MFDSLDEQIKSDLNKQSSSAQRMMLWVVATIATVLVLGGLYYAVRLIGQ
jgi:hypothetical protein